MLQVVVLQYRSVGIVEQLAVSVTGRGKGSARQRQCIAVSEAPDRYGSLHVIWDLTELPATLNWWINRVPADSAGVRAGVAASVGWQVTL